MHMNEVAITLPVVEPYRLDLVVWVLRRRDKNLIDRWDGRAYARVLVVDERAVNVTVTQPNPHSLRILMQADGQITPGQQAVIHEIVTKMLGSSIDLSPLYELVSHDDILAPLAGRFRGMKPPRFPSVFEALVNAIACQQVSLESGLAMLNRLTERYGPQFHDGPQLLFAFPRPEDLIDAAEGDLKLLGFSYQKARAIKQLAYSVLSGQVDPQALESAGDEQAMDDLQKLHGIGRWSAEYALLRGLGRLKVFPGDDIGGQNNIRKLYHLDDRPDYGRIRALMAAWQPYAGLVYFHLLLDSLASKNFI